MNRYFLFLVALLLLGCIKETAPLQEGETTALANDELEPVQVKYYVSKNVKPSELKSILKGIVTERGLVQVVDSINLILVKDSSRGIKNVEDFLNKVDEIALGKKPDKSNAR